MSRLSSRSFTFLHVHHPSQHSYFIPFSESPSLCRRHTAFPLFSPIWLPFQSKSSKNVLHQISSWMTANLLTLISSKTEFLLDGLKQQLAKVHNSSPNCTHLARNLGFIFNKHLTFSDQISALSKSCCTHVSELRCIRPYLYSKTASLIATFVVHS